MLAFEQPLGQVLPGLAGTVEQAQRERAVLERRAVPDDLWKRTLVRYPFLRRRSDPAITSLSGTQTALTADGLTVTSHSSGRAL